MNSVGPPPRNGSAKPGTKPTEPSGRERGDEGFTLLETLVEVLLVSLVLGALAFLAVTTFESWRKTSAAAETGAARELFLAALDQTAGRVAVPFFANPAWGQTLEPAQEGHPLLIPWYRGNPEAFLEAGTDGRRVWLRSWDADFSFDQTGAGFRPLADQGGRVVGLVFEAGGRSYPVRFGSVPAPGDPGQ